MVIVRFEPSMREPCSKRRPGDRAVSAVADDDLAEMGAALEVAVGGRRLFEREDPVDDGAYPMERDCPVHCLEIGSAANADRAETHAAAAQQQGVEHDAGSRQARSDQADMATNRLGL